MIDIKAECPKCGVNLLYYNHQERLALDADKAEEEYINFPDYQYRIFKNKTQVRWIRSLHEILSGYKTYSYLPKDKALCLLHSKHASKHTSRWWNKKK